MDFVVSWWMYLVICPLIFMAGFIDSIAGGGGLISLPAYLALGMPAQFAAGSNKMSAAMGTVLATFRYFWHKKMALVAALVSASLAFPGSYIGATIAQHMTSNTLKIVMLCAVPVAGIAIIIKKKKIERHIGTTVTYIVCALLGFIIGMYDGLIGPGTGTFLIMGYTLLLGYDMTTASGNAKVVNLTSNIAALISFASGGFVLYLLAIPAGLCGIAGAWVGSGLAIKNGEKIIRPMLIVVLVLIFIKIIIDMTQ